MFDIPENITAKQAYKLANSKINTALKNKDIEALVTWLGDGNYETGLDIIIDGFNSTEEDVKLTEDDILKECHCELYIERMKEYLFYEFY